MVNVSGELISFLSDFSTEIRRLSCRSVDLDSLCGDWSFQQKNVLVFGLKSQFAVWLSVEGNESASFMFGFHSFD